MLQLQLFAMTDQDIPAPATQMNNGIDIQIDFQCALPSLSVIRVTGEDRLTFLHSQLTRDLHQLDNDQASMTAWCNPKGRVIATLLLCRRDSHIDLIVASDLKEAVLKKLRMFVLRARVELEDCESLSCLGLGGAAAESLLGETTATVPMAEWRLGEMDDLAVVAIPGPAARFLIYGDREAVDSLARKAASACPPVDASWWTLLNIETGLPWIDHAVSELLLPQMLNLDQIGGLDFNKGCYPGQEVIARLHYRGEVKQRLHYGRSTATELAPGAALYTNSGERAGHIINSVADGNKGGRCLAVISTTATTSLHLGDADGAAVEFST